MKKGRYQRFLETEGRPPKMSELDRFFKIPADALILKVVALTKQNSRIEITCNERTIKESATSKLTAR